MDNSKKNMLPTHRAEVRSAGDHHIFTQSFFLGGVIFQKTTLNFMQFMCLCNFLENSGKFYVIYLISCNLM